MGFQMLLRLENHLALATVSHLLAGIGERNPEGTFDLDSHIGSEVVDFSGQVAHQIKAHDLEHSFAIAPASNVDILEIDELCNFFGHDPGLLKDFTDGSSLGLLALIHESLGEAQYGADAFARSLRLSGRGG